MALAVKSGVPTPPTHGTKQCLRRRTRSSMTDLPDELLENVKKLLDHHTTLMLSMTCRRLNQFFGPRGLPCSQYFKLLQHCATTFSQHKDSILCHACVAIKPGRSMVRDLSCSSGPSDLPETEALKQCLICNLKTGHIDPYTRIIDVSFESFMCPRCRKEGKRVCCTNCQQCLDCLLKNPHDAECGAQFLNEWGEERLCNCKTPGCVKHGMEMSLTNRNMRWPHVVRMPASLAKEKGIDESNVWSDGFLAVCLAVHLPEATQKMRRAVGDEKIQYRSVEATSLYNENADRIFAESDARTVASTYTTDSSYSSGIDPRLPQPVFFLASRIRSTTSLNGRPALTQDRDGTAVSSERGVSAQLRFAALQEPLQEPPQALSLAHSALTPAALAQGVYEPISSMPGYALRHDLDPITQQQRTRYALIPQNARIFPPQAVNFPQPPQTTPSLAARRLQPLRQAPIAPSTPQLTGTLAVAGALNRLSPATRSHLHPSTPATPGPQTQPGTPALPSTSVHPSAQTTAGAQAPSSPRTSAGERVYRLVQSYLNVQRQRSPNHPSYPDITNALTHLNRGVPWLHSATVGSRSAGHPGVEQPPGISAGRSLYTAPAIEVDINGIRAEFVRTTMEEAEVEAEADGDARS